MIYGLDKSISVWTERSVEFQLEQLRQLYVERGVPIEKPASADNFENTVTLLNASNFIGILQNEKDVELLLNIFFSLIGCFEGDQAKALVEQFGQLVTTKGRFQGHGWASSAGAAVRVLSNFFHFHNTVPELQFLEFKYLLHIVGRARLTNFIEVGLDQLEDNAKKWHLSIDQKRELLRLLHTALLQDERPDSAAEVMTALLKTYTAADAERAREDARECVRTAVVDPKSFSFDHLLRLTAVKRLEQTDPLIHRVLKIFAGQCLPEYRQFAKENPNFFHDHLQMDAAGEELLEKKMKVLTLVSMAEKANCISLAEISKAIDIRGEQELEEFIIAAMRMGAINGKIDDMKKELLVSAFQYRNFERPQWETLKQKLGSLLDAMRRASTNIAIANHEDEI